jgi:hypothetical protein
VKVHSPATRHCQSALKGPLEDAGSPAGWRCAAASAK